LPLRPRNLHRSRRSGFWQNWTAWIYFPLAVVLCLVGVSLWKSGKWLVADDAYGKASWGVVLAGESRDCERTDEAIKLYLDGRIDTIVISGERIFRNRYPSEFMINDYVREGVPRGKIFEFHHDAYSTLEEARLLVRQFRLQKLDTVVVITSNYHTARARRIFRKLSQGMPHIIVHSAEYHAYDPASWWSSRESREIWFIEWMKTLFGYWELLRMPAETGKAEYQNLIPDIWTPPGGSAPEAPVSLKATEAKPDTLPLRPPADSAKAPAASPAPVPADSSRDSSQAAKPAPADSAAPRAAQAVTDSLRNRQDTRPDTAAAKEARDSAAHAKAASPRPAKPALAKAPVKSKEAAKKPVKKGKK
jgi:uncharacterized SAM-binding protein YcdF (DUF218 family)